MNFPGHARAYVETPPRPYSIPLFDQPCAAGRFDFRLPILSRSAGLLRILMQAGSLDLDLVSSVVGLDPGLAYRVLHMANRDLPDHRDRIWQLPLAIVSAGRASLEAVLDQGPQVEGAALDQPGIQSLVMEAAMRASLAHSLARELASCSPRKCFLSGLLFELPALVTLSFPARIDSQALLLSDMCHSLPVTIVRAALAQFASKAGPTEPMVAIVLIAQELLRAVQRGDASVEDALGDSLWRPWPGLPVLQRRTILRRCCELNEWVGSSLYHVHPWEFMARLERNATCE